MGGMTMLWVFYSNVSHSKIQPQMFNFLPMKISVWCIHVLI